MEKFTNIEGRESEIEIEERIPIGGGMRGDVFEVQVKVGNRNKTFVVKQFVDFDAHMPTETRTITAAESAETAFFNHAFAKEAGLKTFATYRLGDDKESILMTNGNLEGKVCIGSNDQGRDLEDRGFEKLKEIKNFDELLKGVFNEAVKAEKNNLILWGDALFFLVDNKNSEVDFIIGDYDSLSYNSRNKKINGIEKTNHALHVFVRDNVENPYGYLLKIEDYYQKLIRSSKN